MSDIVHTSGSREGAQPLKHSPSDLRRRARRLAERQQHALRERGVAWVDGRDPFLIERQDSGLAEMGAEKRSLRRDVYTIAPDLEGRPVFRGPPRLAQ